MGSGKCPRRCDSGTQEAAGTRREQAPRWRSGRRDRDQTPIAPIHCPDPGLRYSRGTMERNRRAHSVGTSMGLHRSDVEVLTHRWRWALGAVGGASGRGSPRVPRPCTECPALASAMTGAFPSPVIADVSGPVAVQPLPPLPSSDSGELKSDSGCFLLAPRFEREDSALS